MLTHLEFTNFKSWRHAALELAPISLLFGPNSSGKSSILQFILMLKQTKEATDRSLALELGAPYVDLGTFIDAINGHRKDAELTWKLTWQPASPVSLEDPSEDRSSRLIDGARTVTIESDIV